MLGKRGSSPGVAACGQCGEPRERDVEIAGRLMRELDRRRDVDRLDVDLQKRHVADPSLVLDLDGVVAQSDNEISRAQQAALVLAAGALDHAERKRMVLVDQALGHGRGREGKAVALDHLQQQRRVGEAHCRGANQRDRAPGGRDQLAGARDGDIRCGRDRGARRGRWHRLVGRCERHILRQIEMHRPHRLAQRQGPAPAPSARAQRQQVCSGH